MSIDSFYKSTFTIQSFTQGSTFPYDYTWADGATFRGALDTVSSNDRWADAQLVAISSHFIATKSTVSILKGDRIKYGTRLFEVTGIPDMVTLKSNHHQEVYVKEVTA